MFTALRKIWFYTKLFFTSAMILWRFLVTLVCGAGLGFSGEYIYASLKIPPEAWNMWILASGGLSLVLTLILLWGNLSRHVKTAHTHKKLKETIHEYENSPINNDARHDGTVGDGTYLELHKKETAPKQRLPKLLEYLKINKG